MKGLKSSIESMEQLAVVWRRLVLDRDPGADVRDLPGIAVRWADCDFPFWNCVTLTDIGADAGLVGQRLYEAADIMRAKNRYGFLWVFEDLLEEDGRAALRAAANRAGLDYAFPGTGLAGSPLWRNDMYAYLGLRDGVPVTCAATVEADGRLFVLLFATAPGWERRGYGEAVTRKALHEGATGLTRATLHATVAGALVYPRIGFEPNTQVHFFSMPN